jgi:hypothetical protein
MRKGPDLGPIQTEQQGNRLSAATRVLAACSKLQSLCSVLRTVGPSAGRACLPGSRWIVVKPAYICCYRKAAYHPCLQACWPLCCLCSTECHSRLMGSYNFKFFSSLPVSTVFAAYIKQKMTLQQVLVIRFKQSNQQITVFHTCS